MIPTDDDTLRMLAESAAAFARPDALRTRASRDADHGFDKSAWREIVSFGWLAALVPESQGGLGLGLDAATTIAQRLGYAGHHEPFAGVAVMAAGCLADCTTNAASRLAGVMRGEQMAGLAWQPLDGRIDVEATEVVATEENGTTRLSGDCRFVAVPQADAFIVVARLGDALALYWVERESRGAGLTLEPAADGTVLGRLSLRDVRLPPQAALATGEAAKRAMSRAFESGVVATSAELLGVAERALELTIDYLKTRRQFGQPIGAFQVLQHRAVDMWMQRELTRAALRSALKVFGNAQADDAARSAAASSVKARASQAALYICGQAVQLHGAIGFTDEYELGVYVNRAVTLAARYGNAAQHRRRYAALVPVVER